MIFICLLLILASVTLIRFSFEIWKIIFSFFLLIIALVLCCSVVEAHEYTPTDVVDIGKIIHHEARYESETGKRLVIDTILNRVESPDFPNSVKEVLSQPGQYCDPKEYPDKDIYRLVAEEIYTRTNDKVLWYRTKRYHKYGTPILVEGNHYFSGGK